MAIVRELEEQLKKQKRKAGKAQGYQRPRSRNKRTAIAEQVFSR